MAVSLISYSGLTIFFIFLALGVWLWPKTILKPSLQNWAKSMKVLSLIFIIMSGVSLLMGAFLALMLVGSAKLRADKYVSFMWLGSGGLVITSFYLLALALLVYGLSRSDKQGNKNV